MEIIVVEGTKFIPLWQCIAYFIAGGVAMFGAGYCCCGFLCANRDRNPSYLGGAETIQAIRRQNGV